LCSFSQETKPPCLLFHWHQRKARPRRRSFSFRIRFCALINISEVTASLVSYQVLCCTCTNLPSSLSWEILYPSTPGRTRAPRCACSGWTAKQPTQLEGRTRTLKAKRISDLASRSTTGHVDCSNYLFEQPLPSLAGRSSAQGLPERYRHCCVVCIKREVGMYLISDCFHHCRFGGESCTERLLYRVGEGLIIPCCHLLAHPRTAVCD
jgi:hypothetical protein